MLPRPGQITITYHPALQADGRLDARTAAHDLAHRTRQAILSAMPEASSPGGD